MFRELRENSKRAELAAVLAEYPAPCQSARVEELVRAGLSGAEIYRLSTQLGPLCLRRWTAEHPSLEQLRFMHAVARHVVEAGFKCVAAPMATQNGATFVRRDNHFWELSRWLPGAADWQARPNTARLEAAARALAEFHLAAASFPSSVARTGPSPNIERRLRQAEESLPAKWRTQDLPRDTWPELAALVPRFCSAYERVWPALCQELATASKLAVPLQPCLRDIWHENVLFVNDAVSGLVDFGALAYGSVAADVARLLGSMAGDDRSAWKLGLAAYTAVRPLSAAELTLVPAFDHSFVALAGFQWLEWIVLDHREFSDRARVLARLDEILIRLEHWGAR